MRWRNLIPAAGAALGGILGATGGTALGLYLGAEAVVPPGQAPHETAFAGLLYLPSILLGAAIGGILLAVVGGVLGAWIGSRFANTRTPLNAPTSKGGESS